MQANIGDLLTECFSKYRWNGYGKSSNNPDPSFRNIVFASPAPCIPIKSRVRCIMYIADGTPIFSKSITTTLHLCPNSSMSDR